MLKGDSRVNEDKYDEKVPNLKVNYTNVIIIVLCAQEHYAL